MGYIRQGPLDAGGYYTEFGDGQGGHIRVEYRIDLSAPAMEVWGGRPDDNGSETAEHGTLNQLAVLTP